MNIDDILADIAVDTTPQETRDLQELTRCWVAERVAPEILTWPEELMERVLHRLRRQVCARWPRNSENYTRSTVVSCAS
jgi:GINS complex subunit 4